MSFLDKFKKKPSFKEAKSKKEEKKKVVATEPKEEKKPREVIRAKAKAQSLAYRILLRPLISEKASFLSEQGKYVFVVRKRAKKKEVRQAVFDLYGVRPVRVHLINVRGKERRYGRTLGITSDYKKAIITLPEGKAIEMFEGV